MIFYKDAFKRARESCGLTQADVAKAVGVSKTTVSFWEREDKPDKPRPKRIPAIAEVLHCDVTYISDIGRLTKTNFTFNVICSEIKSQMIERFADLNIDERAKKMLVDEVQKFMPRMTDRIRGLFRISDKTPSPPEAKP